MKRLALVLFVLLAFAGAALAEVKYVETTGELLAPEEKGQNYQLKVWVADEGGLEGQKVAKFFVLAFDDKYERWPEIKKELPKMVGKQVVVKHREGFVTFGKAKILLSRDAKLKK